MDTSEWEIDRCIQYRGTVSIKIPKGWEPFAVTFRGTDSDVIWLRKKKKVYKKAKGRLKSMPEIKEPMTGCLG